MADDITTDTNPAAIERDVRRTQDEMGDTIEKLEEKLTPRNIAHSVMGDDGQEAARDALEVVRRNPIPVALIAVGAIWLFATSDAPMIRDLRNRVTGGRMPAGRRRRGPISRSEGSAPIGPPPVSGGEYDRRSD